MRKKKMICPQFLKNEKGKVTDVYLTIEDYEVIKKRLKEYEKIQKKEGIRWVKCTTAVKTHKNVGKKFCKK